MIKLFYNDICQILYGSTFLAGGGGGPLDIGLKLFDNLKSESLTLYEMTDLENSSKSDIEYVAVLAAMGTPSKIPGRNLKLILTNTIQQLKQHCLACNPPMEITYIMPVEYGGLNTALPLYLALINSNFKLADCDGSGRAVPGLDTTLISINGATITPFVMANEANDSIFLNLGDATDSIQCENVCRDLCSSELFNSVSGVAGWPMKVSSVNQYVNPSSLSYARIIGKEILSYRMQKNTCSCIFDYLNEAIEGLHAITLSANTDQCQTTLLSAGTKHQDNGFDIGILEIHSESNTESIAWEVRFMNENLIVYRNEKPVITVPDIICIFDEDDKIPLTNDYILEHLEKLKNHKISLGILPISEKWLEKRKEIELTAIWKKYFDICEYDGECLLIRP